MNGHLGSGNENSRIQPEKVSIDLKEEEKKIKKLKRKHRDMEEVEELLTLHSFVKSASKGGLNLTQSQAFLEQECLISLHNIHGNENLNNYFLNDAKYQSKNNRSNKFNKIGLKGNAF